MTAITRTPDAASASRVTAPTVADLIGADGLALGVSTASPAVAELVVADGLSDGRGPQDTPLLATLLVADGLRTTPVAPDAEVPLLADAICADGLAA